MQKNFSSSTLFTVLLLQEKETELVKKSKEVFSRNFFGIFLLIFSKICYKLVLRLKSSLRWEGRKVLETAFI